MGRIHPGSADAMLIAVSDTVKEELDDHVFTEDQDPSDRDDKFTFDVTLQVRTRAEYEWLREMVKFNIDFTIESYD
jgi:hypothetical protein